MKIRLYDLTVCIDLGKKIGAILELQSIPENFTDEDVANACQNQLDKLMPGAKILNLDVLESRLTQEEVMH